MKVVVTGAAGYIGSHMCKLLVKSGYEVLGLDNLSTSTRTHRYGDFVAGDISDPTVLIPALDGADAVFHFAASSLVGESTTNLNKYFENNVAGTINLLSCMVATEVKQLVFSSTAAVYGEGSGIPLTETDPCRPINPYGVTKLMIEATLPHYEVHGIRSVAFRYFNAAGASSDGDIGESHYPETHLIPNVIKAFKAFKQGEEFTVNGNDFDTPDGTCIRDYVHVDDICDAHLRAYGYLSAGGTSQVLNLGTGVGTSVLQVIKEVEKSTGNINLRFGPRRVGDPASLVANATRARAVLGWEPKRDLSTICRSAVLWEGTK